MKSQIDVQKIVKRAESFVGKDSDIHQYHEDLAEFCLPRKAWQTTIKNVGERLKLNSLYDSTAIRAVKICSAGFHSNLTNPSSKWFSLRTRNQDLMKSKDVQMWFKNVEDVIFSVLNSSNFDSTMQEFYCDSTVFGTGAVLTLDDPSDKVRFTIIDPKQLAFEEDAQGRVNRVYRSYTVTAQQAVDLWGQDAGKKANDSVKEKPDMPIEVLHYVGPRDKRDMNKDDALNMPWVSCWIEKSEKHLIKESGFFEFPYAVGRFFKDSTDVWGFSPAMDVLADIKLVNAQVRTMLRASMKAADPALVLPSRGFILPLNLNPSALNYRDEKTPNDALQQIPSSGNIPITLEVIRSVQDSIEKGFYVPLFRALSDITKQMTIPEVQRRIAENMVLLGPVIGRFTDEVLDPILVRVFSILYRSGELPPAPEEIQDEEMEVVYISPLAKAQRESEMFAIESLMTNVVQIAQFKPEILDKVNADKVYDVIARIKGTTPEITNSQEEVDAMREQKAQAAQQQNKMMMMQQGAQVLQQGAAANKQLADAEQVGKE